MKKNLFMINIMLAVTLFVPLGRSLATTDYIPGSSSDVINSHNIAIDITNTDGITETWSVPLGEAVVQVGKPQVYLPLVQSVVPVEDMITIPAGTFKMGCSSSDTACWENEYPLHTVYLSTYSIDKYEVVNARYKACVDADGCTAPHNTRSYTRQSYYGNQTYDNYPVIYVDWYQAAAFCAWEGKRLPTEAEWEKAARGANDTRIYPWGNQAPDCTLANIYYNKADCVGDTSEVGSYPAGASPYGVLDMAGNVGEWVNDWFQPGYYSSQSSWSNPLGPSMSDYKVLRGGTWDGYWYDARVSYRYGGYPANQANLRGFRCSRSP
jgi:formylglycine-generating enzyme required for sulfatase activity